MQAAITCGRTKITLNANKNAALALVFLATEQIAIAKAVKKTNARYRLI